MGAGQISLLTCHTETGSSQIIIKTRGNLCTLSVPSQSVSLQHGLIILPHLRRCNEKGSIVVEEGNH